MEGVKAATALLAALYLALCLTEAAFAQAAAPQTLKVLLRFS